MAAQSAAARSVGNAECSSEAEHQRKKAAAQQNISANCSLAV
jgi:hypothetical protein